MTLVLLAQNGVGLGHLIRTTIVCRGLEALGEHPVVFSQGTYRLEEGARYPGRDVPPLWAADALTRHRVSSDLRSMLQMSLPAVLVEDTHPNPIRLPARIRRVLIVRPTSFAYLSRLHRHYDHVYSVFLLCDAPESPTWPYSGRQTEEILGWRKWHVIGPIYRRPAEADIADVRRRYGLVDGRRLLVFTMGGGGQHHPGDTDLAEFVALADRLVEGLGEERIPTRAVFVQGPYHPGDAHVSGRFEVVRHEPRLPALLAAADGAVIRGGFNTIWECLAAGTPFWPFVGTTCDEPTEDRLSHLRALGLVAPDFRILWADPAWRAGFRWSCERLAGRWSGQPSAHALQLVVARGPFRRIGPPVRAQRPGLAARLGRRFYRRAMLARYGRYAPLVIRVDDVTSLDPALDWLLRLLASRGLQASLEVVPYLLEFDERALATYDPSAGLFEVSQHGYAHVARSGSDGRRYEFAAASSAPTEGERRDLAWGKARLERAFPRRFSRGFSAPFDALPAWLPALWRSLDGAFVSSLGARGAADAPIPVVDAGRDIWDWSRDRAYAVGELMRAIDRHVQTSGHAGLGLHPRCLRSRRERERLIRLLDRLQGRGFAGVSLRALAQAGEVQRPPAAPTPGGLLSAVAGWALR